MEKLEPLKFRPQLKERMWGGDRLRDYGKDVAKGGTVGESWEISTVKDSVSVVAGGRYDGQNLTELIARYKGELVGEAVYGQYGDEFPLLIKLIDAHDVLSIQVHPDDRLAKERHGCAGKTEMWYVMDTEPGTSLYAGFDHRVSRDEYLTAVEKGTVSTLLRRVPVKRGDSIFIPAGTIHAIGKGVLVAEIQQASDITYRVDDWGRVDSEGNPRQLHTMLAVDAIDFGGPQVPVVSGGKLRNVAEKLAKCTYFTTNIISVDGAVERDYSLMDSFVIFICTAGSVAAVTPDGVRTELTAGETMLLPACMKNLTVEGKGEILEVYVE